jgi:hypothetical protein
MVICFSALILSLEGSCRSLAEKSVITVYLSRKVFLGGQFVKIGGKKNQIDKRTGDIALD